MEVAAFEAAALGVATFGDLAAAGPCRLAAAGGGVAAGRRWALGRPFLCPAPRELKNRRYTTSTPTITTMASMAAKNTVFVLIFVEPD